MRGPFIACLGALLAVVAGADCSSNAKSGGGTAGSDAGGGSSSGGNAGGGSSSGSDDAGGSSEGDSAVVTSGQTFGTVHSGSYNNGPVDFAETVYHNSCAPYPAAIQQIYGNMIAGVDNSLNGDGSLCDACALVTTRLGKSVLVHIVTTGVSKAPGDMDLSPQAYDAIYEADPQGTSAIPRPMTWQLARCPGAGNIELQYQTAANVYWTSLWTRNIALPVQTLEVKSANHATFFALTRGSDGSLTDSSGFGTGPFVLRMTAQGGEAVTTQSFPSFTPGALVDSGVQF